MSLYKLIIVFIFLVINLYSNKLEKVSLQLDWLHQFQFAGYYIAKEKGFYQNENLDVTIKEFDFNINLLNDILSQKSEYAVGKSSLIIDKLEGKDIVLLSAIYQSSPMILLSLKNSNINKPHDLKNKRVMLTPDARSAASINSMIISQGLKLNDINFQPHSFKLEDLINGKTDAMGCYLSNEPYLLKQQGIEFDIHNPSDYGFDFYGGLLFTSQKELINNPLRVRGFYKATLKGWKYAFENIEETARLIFEKYNTQKKSLDALIYEGQVLKKLAKFEEGLLGDINSKKIEEIKRLYLLLGLSNHSPKFKLSDLIYNPYEIKLTQEEKEYLEQNKITLVTNSNYPPFTISKNNILSGIEIDYWHLLNKKLKVSNSTIQIIDSNKIALKKVEDDPNIVKYAFGKRDSNQFAKKTNSVGKIAIGLVTLNDKPFISDVSNLSGKKVAISKYSSIYQHFKFNYPDIDYVETKNVEESLQLLSQNKVFGVIGKLPTLSYLITKNTLTNMKISGTFDEKFNIKLLVNKYNKTLLDILNKAILTFTDEERNNINTKYYSVIYQTSFNYSWFYKIIIPLVLIILIIVFTNRKLNNEIKKRKKIEERLNNVANIDGLTNIYNRRKIEALYNKELIRVRRYKRELSIIFLDIDNFKAVNDKLGHAIGDDVLVKLSSVIKNNIRETDFFGRWGGEEFVIILPETNKEKAANVAHVLKEKINMYDFNIDRDVTCSFGVSQFEETDSADTLLTRADNAMYYVKRNGKNNVKVA